jgi:hypothetical protein
MAEDIVRLQRQRAQAEAAGDTAAAARFDQRLQLASREQQMGPPVNETDQAAAEARDVNPAWDVLRSVGTGLRSAVEGVPGAPQDMLSLAGKGYNWIMDTDQSFDVPYLPSSDDINQATSKVIGPSYQPQTTAGKYARTAAEFMPMGNPLGSVRKGIDAGTSLIAGLTSEAAGQATEGTSLEPWARGLTGIGVGAGGRGAVSGVEGAITSGGRKAEAAAEDAALQHGVRLTRGERTGNVTQQMEEQQMLHGTRGNRAQQALEMRRQENLAAIKDAGTGFADTTAPTRGTDPVQSANTLQQSTRGRAEGLMDQGGKAIQEGIEGGVVVDAQRLKGLPDELNSTLTGIDPYIPDVAIDANTPMAAKALGTINTFVKKFEDPTVIDDSLASVERLRRTIGNMKATTPEDSRALGKLMQGFDDWYDDVIANDAAVVPNKATGQFSLPGKDPADILGGVKQGRATFKEGADIARPRGKEPGSKEVAKIATEGTLPEETARLFKLNDRGDMSTGGIKALDRLTKVGASSGDLDQVRGIVLDTLLNGDPGKVNTRIANFTRNNPTAAANLFTPEQLQRLKDYGGTNKRLVPDAKATNPSKSSYGIIKEMGKSAVGKAVGSVPVVGPLLKGAGDVISDVKGGAAAKQALAAVDRAGLAAFIMRGAGTGVRKSGVGSIQGAQSMTVTAEDSPYYGQRGEIISEGRDGMKLRMPDGTTQVIGKRLLEPAGAD